MLAWIVAAVFVASKAPDIVWRRFHARPHVIRGRRLRIISIALFACCAGFAFFLGWLAVRVPGRLNPELIDSQPAPPGLWQAAMVLLGVGVGTLVMAYVTAPTEGEAEPMKPLSEWFFALILAAFAIPLVIASATATRSKLRGDPLMMAAVMVVVLPFTMKDQFAHPDRGPFGKADNLTDAIASALGTHLWPVVEGYDKEYWYETAVAIKAGIASADSPSALEHLIILAVRPRLHGAISEPTQRRVAAASAEIWQRLHPDS